MRMMLTLAKRFSRRRISRTHSLLPLAQAACRARRRNMGAASSGDAVKIMTIHKSKGLEFPVVFVCDTSRRFNDADLKQTVLVHRKAWPWRQDLRHRAQAQNIPALCAAR